MQNRLSFRGRFRGHDAIITAEATFGTDWGRRCGPLPVTNQLFSITRSPVFYLIENYIIVSKQNSGKNLSLKRVWGDRVKSVSIFVRGITNSASSQKEGKYIAILHYYGYEKVVSGKEINTTSNRMVIRGLIEAIKLLKEPCDITIYTHCNFGINKYPQGNKGVNRDIATNLFKLIEVKGHKLNYIFGNERQQELINKLRLI